MATVSRPPIEINHDKQKDASQFSLIDSLNNGNEAGLDFDGIDVTINPSDDEFEQEMEQITEMPAQFRSRSPTNVNWDIQTAESVSSINSVTNASNILGEQDPVRLQLQQENANLKKIIDEMVNQRVE